MKRNANGQGSFINLSNGKIRMRKQCGYLPNGKPKILTVTEKTQSACIRAMQVKEKEWIKSMSLSDTIAKETMIQLCYRHLEADKKNKVSLKPGAIDRRECTIRNQIEKKDYRIGQMQVQAITSLDISKHIHYLIGNTELSVSSVKKTFDVINSAFNWAVRHDYIDKNPCDSISDEIKSEFKSLTDIEDANIKKVKSLSPKQIELLIRTCDIRNANDGRYKFSAALYVKFLLYTGIRCGELCALRYRDFQYIENKIFMTIDKTRSMIKNRSGIKEEQNYIENEGKTKNVKVRILELNSDAMRIFEEIKNTASHTSDDDYLVINENYKPTTPSKLGKCINTIYRNAKLPSEITGAHILRKTFATQRYKEGIDVTRIATYLGDIPSTVWEHYISGQDSIDAGFDKGIINYVSALQTNIDTSRKE